MSTSKFVIFHLSTGHKYTRSLPDKFMSLVHPLILVSTVVVPICTGIVLVYKPCLPPFVGSMLPGCRNGSGQEISSIQLKLGLAIFEAMMFVHVAGSGAFYIVQVIVAASLSLWNHLRIFKEWWETAMYFHQNIMEFIKFCAFYYLGQTKATIPLQ